MKDVKIQLNVMVGLPGSGKSSYIKKTKSKDGLYIISADDVREDFPEIEDNSKIFDLVYEKLEILIKSIYENALPNACIYLDNTNLVCKKRKKIFEVAKKLEKSCRGLNINVTAIIMSTPFETCLERNKNRKGKVVPEEVIYKYRASFNIPFYEEGFNEIKIIDGFTLNEITQVQCDFKKYTLMAEKMINFDQENPHHRYTLGNHMIACQELVLSGEETFNKPFSVYVAALVHDWGKYYTKSYNANGIGIYYNHGEVGAYELLSDLTLIPQMNFPINAILEVLAYVNYHMKPFNWNTKKALKKAYETYGKLLFEDLIKFNKIDKEACGTESEQITG